jgi:hypothetical protein
MKPEDKQKLNAAVLRATGEDPIWLGYWIKRFEQSEGVHSAEVANQLGLGVDSLVLLCLCRLPRVEHFQDDLRIICHRTGAKEDALARIIRQEQALTKWRAPKSPETTGWLLAASDSDDDEKVRHEGGNAEAGENED